MTIFSRPLVLLAMLAIFILSGLIGGPQNSFDIAASDAMVEFRHRWPELTSLAAIATQVGSVYSTLGLGLLAATVIGLRGRHGAAVLLAAAVVFERLSVDGLKFAIGRPRPDLDLPFMPASASFPSGHSANSMAVFVTIALIAAPPSWRRSALEVAIGTSILVGFTRVVLGVHWPTDVIGGWAWGLLVVGLALSAGRRSGAIEAQHDVVGGHFPPAGQD
jgi:membrane-associated phospholipid phosphatase